MATKLTAHEEDQVNLCDDMLDGLNWCSRVQHNSSFHPQVLDLHHQPNSITASVVSTKMAKQKLQQVQRVTQHKKAILLSSVLGNCLLEQSELLSNIF
jgi:predicted phage tail protein